MRRTMILEQYYLGCLAHASYLVADEAAGVGGGRRSPAGRRRVHRRRRAPRLQDRARPAHAPARRLPGRPPRAPRPRGREDLPRRPGRGRVRVHPARRRGHRRAREGAAPGARDARATRRSRSRSSSTTSRPTRERPNALLSGDTLFIGDVGRPDLRASLGWSAEELGSLLYDSIQTKILPLPDDTLVYPAHGAGSLCGKHLSSETVSTIGIQRQYNYALQPMSREDFIRIVLADQPDSPAYFTYDAVLNTKERADARRGSRRGIDAALPRPGARARRPVAHSCSTAVRTWISRAPIFAARSTSASTGAMPPGSARSSTTRSRS